MSQRRVDPEVHGASHQVNLHHFTRSGLRFGRETEGERKNLKPNYKKENRKPVLKIFL
jgi:hypothetical protein